MGHPKYPGERRKDLCFCVGSYKLKEGETEIGLPDGNHTDYHFRFGKMRFIVYDNRVLKDKTLAEEKKETLNMLPKNVSKALVTARPRENGVFYEIALDGKKITFEEEVEKPDVVCLGSYPLDSSVQTFNLPEGSYYSLIEDKKIKFYPEDTKKMGKLRKMGKFSKTPEGTKERRNLVEIPEWASKVTITPRHGPYTSYYNLEWE